MEEKLSNSQLELRLAQKDSRSVCVKLADKELKVSTLEGDLRVEREWRMNLQEDKLKDSKALEELKSLVEEERKKRQDLISNLELASKEIATLTLKNREQEGTLEEMGVKVKESRLMVEELKESGGRWKSDGEAVACRWCEKVFSLTRRRHHCRSCGEIFCRVCSDNQMELASSSKPVRVCDSCFGKSLVRFNAN